MSTIAHVSAVEHHEHHIQHHLRVHPLVKTATKRLYFYMSLLVLAIAIATMAGLLKLGHLPNIEHFLSHLWQSIVHFVGDVACAEMTAAILYRFTGVIKE